MPPKVELAAARIRCARASDVASLEQLERVAFTAAWRGEQLSAVLTQRNGLGLVASEGGRIVGYALFLSVLDEAELLRLAVAPSARRRGIAHLLLDAGAETLWHRGVRNLFLEVRADNAGALALYRRTGWKISGRRRGYYADGTDALLLQRQLTEAVESADG